MLLPLFMTLAGLILLLSGLNTLRNGLEKFAGSYFQQALIKFTATPGKGFISGMISTAFLQSSTALTLMTVSFVDARLIGYDKALGLILGSNVGTTLTPQLLAFPLDKIAVWFIIPGLLGYWFIKNNIKHLFRSIAGLGIMFLSLYVLESAMYPLTEQPQVHTWLSQLNSHLYAVFAGTILSALLHSSSAVTGVGMVLTEQGLLDLPAALALIFGANIGTCFTALIVSFFISRPAQKVAVFHVLLNLFGVLVFYPFIQPLACFTAYLGGDLSRQVANAHTFFNLVTSLIALPLLPYITKLLK